MACSIALGQIDESMREWVLIDTASTVNVFCNKEFMRDVRKAPPLVVHTNAGTFTIQEKATLLWCEMDVWIDPHAITNVLSFATVQEHFPVLSVDQLPMEIYSSRFCRLHVLSTPPDVSTPPNVNNGKNNRQQKKMRTYIES
jgi:hypothetical protein